MRDRLPHLKAIVQYKGKLSQNYPYVYGVRQCTSNMRVVHGKLNAVHTYLYFVHCMIETCFVVILVGGVSETW